MTRLLVLLLSLGVLHACADDIQLPPAQPLKASAEQLAQIPNFQSGPHSVKNHGPKLWRVDGQELRIRVFAPEAEGPFPLLLFSHGFASDIDQYDAMLQHWASHGYIIIAPYHLDGGGTARAIFNSLRKGNMGLIQARLDDMQFLLDQLPQLDQLIPNISQRIDPSRIAATGHSFGAFTAQQLGGALAIEEQQRIGVDATRVKAVVAISPPGEMFGVIKAASWQSLRVPMLATTGTWDIDGHFVTDWKQHSLSYQSAPAGQNWLLVTQGADHYFGNLICRLDREALPQQDALNMANAAVVNFLHAQLKADQRSAEFLHSNELAVISAGFSQLSQR